MSTNNLQQRLKEETLTLHKESENTPLMKSLIEGSFKKEHLLKLLINLYPIYQVVEQRLIREHVFANNDLKRSDFIDLDINSLAIDLNYPDYNISELTKEWVSNSWKKPLHLLKADLYVRWLADFYGGRILSQSLAPYNHMYNSKDPKEVILSIRDILDDTQEENNDSIVEEANNLFKFHLALFNEIWNQTEN